MRELKGQGRSRQMDWNLGAWANKARSLFYPAFLKTAAVRPQKEAGLAPAGRGNGSPGFSPRGHHYLIFFCFLLSPGLALAAQNLDSAFFEKLIPLHQVKTPPGPFDWLAVNQEEGQSFEDFVKSSPARPDERRRYIYLQKLGDFSQKQEEALNETAKFIEAYYQLPVKFLPPQTLENIPAEARRVHPQTGDRQVLSTYLLEKILLPEVPVDSFCLIAFSSDDLWPGEGWNFVFGQASLPDRVGVWSLYRNGDANASPEEYALFLRRTISTALHEIGHMFGLYHCIYFECLMNGSNYRKEADRRPFSLCPVCLRKILWDRDIDAGQRFRQLQKICADLGFEREKIYYEKAGEFIMDKVH
jgi:archaemetzincin